MSRQQSEQSAVLVDIVFDMESVTFTDLHFADDIVIAIYITHQSCYKHWKRRQLYLGHKS